MVTHTHNVSRHVGKADSGSANAREVVIDLCCVAGQVSPSAAGGVVAGRTLSVLEVSALGVAAISLALRPGDWVCLSMRVFPPASCMRYQIV